MDKLLCTIFQDLFDVPVEHYSDKLAMADVDRWDSIQHLTLLLTVEEAFSVRFSPEEYGELTSVKQIKAALEAQQGCVQ